MTLNLSMPPQVTCSTNLASLSQTGTASSKALTQSVAQPGDASSVAKVWPSRASPNARLVIQSQVEYRLLSWGCKVFFLSVLLLCCGEEVMYQICITSCVSRPWHMLTRMWCCVYVIMCRYVVVNSWKIHSSNFILTTHVPLNSEVWS